MNFRIIFIIFTLITAAAVAPRLDAHTIWALEFLPWYWMLPTLTLALLFWWQERQTLPDRVTAVATHSGRFLDRLLTERPLDLALFRGLSGAALLLLISLGTALLLHRFGLRLILPPPEGMGDSLHLIEHLPVYSHLFGYLDSFDETLELWFRSAFYLIAESQWGWSARESYAVVSSILGFFYTLSVLYFLRRFPWPYVLIGLALLLINPRLQLYAAYVENYSYSSLLLLWQLILLWELFELRGDCGAKAAPLSKRQMMMRQRLLLLATAAVAALGAMFHLVLGLMAPALAMAVYLLSKRERIGFLTTAIAPVLLGGAMMVSFWLWFLYLAPAPISFGDSHTSNPPIYPLSQFFSLVHFSDTLQLWILGTPAAVVLVWLSSLLLPFVRQVVRLRPSRWSEEELPAHVAVFSVALLFYILFALIVNPLIGFPADWDLLTFFHLPLAFWLLSLLWHSDYWSSRRLSLLRVGSVVLLFSATLAVAWLARNHADDPRSAVREAHATETAHRVLDFTAEDPIYQALEAGELGDGALRLTLERQRLYLRIILFYHTSKYHLERLEHERGLATSVLPGKELESAWQEFRALLLLPPERFDAELPAVWRRLTQVNLEIHQRLIESRI